MENSDMYIDDESSVEEEASLWRAVITQALMDAKSNSKKRSFIKAKKEAISWLLGGSDDFLFVCEMADLDSEYVMERAKKAIDRGCVWRKINLNNYKESQKKIPVTTYIKSVLDDSQIIHIDACKKQMKW